jgi:hypothetical protein
MKYLLNSETNFPLSVDTSVWPSVKSDLRADEIFYDYDVVSNGLNLFNLRDDQYKPLTTHNINKSIVIAIGFCPKDAQHLIKQHKINFSPTNDKIQKKLLHFLGYDICDNWLISGLMNCGLDKSNHDRLKSVFKRYLNNYGLFYDFNIAMQFASEINNIISGHIPFIPSGLFAFDIPPYNIDNITVLA